MVNNITWTASWAALFLSQAASNEDTANIDTAYEINSVLRIREFVAPTGTASIMNEQFHSF